MAWLQLHAAAPRMPRRLRRGCAAAVSLQYLKRIAYLLLSNSRLRSFVLCALCASAVLFPYTTVYCLMLPPLRINRRAAQSSSPHVPLQCPSSSVPLRLCGWVSASRFTTAKRYRKIFDSSLPIQNWLSFPFPALAPLNRSPRPGKNLKIVLYLRIRPSSNAPLRPCGPGPGHRSPL